MSLSALIRTVIGDRAFTELRRHYQSRKLMRGDYEISALERAFISTHVKRGSIVLDIGANIGVYTKFLSEQVGSEGLVFAFEPIPETYASLLHNAQRFGNRNVITCHSAVADKSGICSMHLDRTSDRAYYRARLRTNRDAESLPTRVLQLSLDDLREDLKPVDFIKCDVEGAELLVLHGSESLILRDRPALLLEVQEHTEAFGSNPQDIFSWLEARGWSGYCFRSGRLSRASGPVADNEGPNYAFLFEDRAASVSSDEELC